MTTKISTMILAGALLLPGATFAGTAQSATDCDDAAISSEYARQADEYEAAAQRYRNWAHAEAEPGSSVFGKRYAIRYFEEQARQLEVDAEQSRALAGSCTAAGTARDSG